jgi:Fe-S oxidoreductase
VNRFSKRKNKNQKGLLGVKIHQFLSFSSPFDQNVTFGGKYAFFPGCSMIAHSPDLVMAVYEYLRDLWPDVGLFGSCCAKPALALDKRVFSQYQEALKRQLRKGEVHRAIVCCPNCAVTLKRIPELEVVSIWQILNEHPAARASGFRLPPLVLHDPCPVKKTPEVYEAIREVFSRLDVAFEEYPANRDKTLCCGKINMLMVLDPDKSRELLTRRVSQSSGRDVLTYCFSCVDSFKSVGCGSLHGLDYIFTPAEKIDMNGRESLGQTWRNRWITARRIAALRK